MQRSAGSCNDGHLAAAIHPNMEYAAGGRLGARDSMSIADYLMIPAGAALLWLLVLPFVRARCMVGKPAPRFADQELPPGKRALVYFFSKSCGMCRSMTPQIEHFAGDHANVFLIDVVGAPELARSFAVMGTPTTVLVRDGKVERVWVGSLSPAQLHRVFRDL